MILLIPVGITGRYILEALVEPLSDIFEDKVTVGERLQPPAGSWAPSRHQYLAFAIMGALPSPSEASDRVLGILDADLFAPGLNFIFGQALLNGDKAVISVTRLREEYYGGTPDEKLFLDRVIKEAVHELGHTYGLAHCPDPKCVMHFSNSLADTDHKERTFCPPCDIQLSHSRIMYR